MFSHSDNSSAYSACDNKYGDISNDVYNYPYEPVSYANARPYGGVRNSITSVNIENKIKPKNMQIWFAELRNLSSIDCSNIDTSQCTSIQQCFANSDISQVNVQSWNTSSITNMQAVFADCFALTSVNVSAWDTSNVTDMRSMFRETGLTSLDLSSFNTENVRDFSFMFNESRSLTHITYNEQTFIPRSRVTDENMYQTNCPANRIFWYTGP